MTNDFLVTQTVFNQKMDGKAVSVYGKTEGTSFGGEAYLVAVNPNSLGIRLIGRFNDEDITMGDVESGDVKLTLLIPHDEKKEEIIRAMEDSLLLIDAETDTLNDSEPMRDKMLRVIKISRSARQDLKPVPVPIPVPIPYYSKGDN